MFQLKTEGLLINLSVEKPHAATFLGQLMTIDGVAKVTPLSEDDAKSEFLIAFDMVLNETTKDMDYGTAMEHLNQKIQDIYAEPVQ